MSIYAAKRQTSRGTRWYVRCELPGRPIIHLGTYDTLKRAEKRIEAAKDEIAAGRIPQRFPDTPTQQTTLAEVAATWLDTRHDMVDRSRSQYATVIRNWPTELATADPHAIGHLDVQLWVTSCTKTKKRGSIARDLNILRMALDYAGVAPNPARDQRVRLPRAAAKTLRLPNRAEIATLHEILPTRRELLILLEHTGLRIHEAANLRWRDIDVKRDRLLVAKSKTAAGTRWVDRLPDAPPLPVKPDGASENSLIFGSPSAMTLSNVMRQAHKRGRTPLFSAHDFRHLHCSRLLHDQILSPAQIAARVGHANPGVTLGVYAHVLPPG